MAHSGERDAGSTEAYARSERLPSLDAFRGVAILALLVVNNLPLGRLTPVQLIPSGWSDGIRFADMLFPWFLLALGFAIPFSTRLIGGPPGKRLVSWKRVLGRAVVLIALGCLVDSSIVRHPVIGLGGLQIIGLTYLLTAPLYGIRIQLRVVVAAGLLLAHWALVASMPALGALENLAAVTGGAHHQLNRSALALHPIGTLLILLSTCALALIGSALGEIVRHGADSSPRNAARLVIAGLGLLLLGLLWSRVVPITPTLWTPSFVLVSGGCGVLIVALFHLGMGAAAWRRWTLPLRVFGANSLVAYVVPVLVKTTILQVWHWTTPDGSIRLHSAVIQFFTTNAGLILGALAYALFYVSVAWLLVFLMYRRRWFVRA